MKGFRPRCALQRLPLAAAAVLAAAAWTAVPLQAADFMQTVVGQAPLQSAQDAQACQKQAEQQLAAPRAKLQKQCEDAGGEFNWGLTNLSLHRDSCTVYQSVTCSGTGTPAAQAQAQKADLPQDRGSSRDASVPPGEAPPSRPPARGRAAAPAAPAAPAGKKRSAGRALKHPGARAKKRKPGKQKPAGQPSQPDRTVRAG